MIKMNLLIAVLAFTFSASSFAGNGQGGMNECVVLSVKAALEEFSSRANGSDTIPDVTVSQSDGSPSNGIDMKISVNAITFYTIATPNIVRGEMKGCLDARVGYTN